MNIDQVCNGILAAITLLVLAGFGVLAYQDWKDGKKRSKHDPIIQLWKNTEPRIQVSGKKYLQMLDNL